MYENIFQTVTYGSYGELHCWKKIMTNNENSKSLTLI